MAEKRNFKKMMIEMHTPASGLPEIIVQKAKQAMLTLTHLHNAITRIHCRWREDGALDTTENKICEIRAEVDGEQLFTHARTDDYASALEEAFRHVWNQVSLLAAKANDLPDAVTSTVKV